MILIAKVRLKSTTCLYIGISTLHLVLIVLNVEHITLLAGSKLCLISNLFLSFLSMLPVN